MSKNKKIFNSLKYTTMITQLGISVVTPILLCIFGALWLKGKFNLGNWIVICGIVVGVSSGFYSLMSYFYLFLKDAKKDQEEYNNQFKK